MKILSIIIFIAFLFLCILYTLGNTFRLIYKDPRGIPMTNALLQAIGITGTIAMLIFCKNILF